MYGPFYLNPPVQFGSKKNNLEIKEFQMMEKEN